MDLTDSIVPKSDQLNADDLMSGPRTVTISEVRRGNAEQPVDVVLTEFGPGRPFKPCKSMRRVMVAAWGAESSAYIGKRMTLYRDPGVKFGGQEMGGIRISHMSGIERRLPLALTVTRGKRAPYIVEPLPDGPVAAASVTRAQMDEMAAAFQAVGVVGKPAMLDYCRNLIGRGVASAADLSSEEAAQVIDALRQDELDTLAVEDADAGDVLPGVD